MNSLKSCWLPIDLGQREIPQVIKGSKNDEGLELTPPVASLQGHPLPGLTLSLLKGRPFYIIPFLDSGSK